VDHQLTELEHRVITFLANWTKTRKDITTATSLVDDLGMWGDDADDFLIDFGKQFNVNVYGFPRAKYFGVEESPTPLDLIRFVLWLIGKWQPAPHEPRLTVADLVRAAQLGRFDVD
jgi:hypothetical protein